MKGLSNLIRLHKWKLDEKRRELTDMEQMRDSFMAQRTDLQREQQREQEIAAEDPDINFAYSNYATAAKERLENLQTSISEISQKIIVLKDEVSFCYRELKKYEVALDVRDKRARLAEQRAEQKQIDDLAIDLYRRGLQSQNS
ncbi:flagellar FliJ family protein [Sneathiella marina]|uniref:Flagellar FliJ family protein n=1 Tax=Sneathiella marina TaxID=2950108 RepID=A0ABY4W323_9PROT|nr:flagellar FliJ family protein [Sneathiella marina]USG60518.1 flagellar FliJ family protein [Sneathiella marina]